ncbi:transcriptional regulator [Rhodococcus opacus PD630]|uniref:FCD domain-containing protein n=1 Tax=Rhodococcus opacus TaxID=37919 RepID=UPI00029CC5F0|nr:FCD domain-containing protein [Rhodococcus opacus]AHK35919.1 putative HTH-type transcriptional regulator BphR [Rhodococcus opacus PD630]EHI43476.1 transcriptional regulator [Rhodococcus opacus PD630]MDT2009376.1 FCD domain-containing protein [Rhodococcus opacus]UDH01355.1 FCD domain-containing protein [Rhodococcus opacus PD630]
MTTIDTVTPAVPIAHQAAAQLRRDIIEGTFAPGSKLKMDVLQSLYGFSSSPLREALSQLAHEGLVRADARRGFRVTPISVPDFRDIAESRLLIDPAALEKSIDAGDEEWESSVVASYYRLEKVEQRLGDGPVVLDDQWAELHKQFHMTLIAACPSERLRQYSSRLFDQAERYRRASALHRQRPRNKSREHEAIKDATLERDADRACELLRQHISRTLQDVENWIRSAT